MKRVIIVHGWGNNPSENWFPWLKTELDKIGCHVVVPGMPDTEHPSQQAWVNHLNTIIRNPDQDTFLVGHSLGCIAILRYLEGLPNETKIGGIFLVAAFAQPIGYAEPDSFFKTPVDFNKIKNALLAAPTIINSDNDGYISNETTRMIHENLGGELIIVKNGGHLTAKDGYAEFPALLEVLSKKLR